MSFTPEQTRLIQKGMEQMVVNAPFEAIIMLVTPDDVIISTPSSIIEDSTKARNAYVLATTTLAKNLIEDTHQQTINSSVTKYEKEEDDEDEKEPWQK